MVLRAGLSALDGARRMRARVTHDISRSNTPREAMTVYAEVGNWLVVRGRTLDVPTREGQIVEVPHADGSPPYVVHWLDQDRLSTVFPGPDTTVSPVAPHAVGASSPRRHSSGSGAKGWPAAGPDR